MRRRALFPLLLLASCSDRWSPFTDAAPIYPSPDAAPPADAGAIALAVDFTVQDCPTFDPTVPSCTGTAPFTVQFVPIATAAITRYLWTFSDGGTDTSPTPSHTFNTPGLFDVTLVGVGATGGVAPPKTYTSYIVALADVAGGPCQDDGQCAKDLHCLCSAANPCTTGPLAGMCTALCQKNDCPDGSVCANMVTAAMTSNHADPWQTQVCLPACRFDTDCKFGFRCRTLPAWPNGATWVHGCFADVPADLGGPCLTADGVRRNDLCVTGLCADLGALGQCSRDCTTNPCPMGSDCAVFGDGRELCLLPCSSTFACDKDPLLTCAAAGASLLGYQIKAPVAGGTGAYCAPKPCGKDADCGAAGLCRHDSGGNHCIPVAN